MEQKTKVSAEAGKQELVITREFDLPVELLFKAHTDPEITEQWMGTRVLKLEGKKHGSYQFKTTDAQRNAVFQATASSMNLARTGRSPGLLKWKTRPLACSLKFWNLKNHKRHQQTQYACHL
jgi:hypothetical protein